MYTPKTLGEYHDQWTLVSSAEWNWRDHFSFSGAKNQTEALRLAFDTIRAGFHFARKKLKDDRLSRIAEELIEMACEAYLSGDFNRGSRVIRECEGMIWPKYQLRIKHSVEAERRAFGENITYAGVVVTPYPYEGTRSDLSANQLVLLELAEGYARFYQDQQKEFRCFSWVIDSSGCTKRISIAPKEDDHPILPPAQRGWGYKRLKELGQAGLIRACVLMEASETLRDGHASYRVEDVGHPRVFAVQRFTRRGASVHYEPMRYHVDDSDIFPDRA